MASKSERKAKKEAALDNLDDTRTQGYDPIVPLQILHQEYKLSEKSMQTIEDTTEKIKSIFLNNDDKVLIVVGPETIDDIKSGKEYASKIKELESKFGTELVFIMRTNFEKKRNEQNKWRGLIHDPNQDGTCQINKGLRIVRQLLCEITDSGVAIGANMVDVVVSQYLKDLYSWGAVSTTQCRMYNEFSSGCSFPVAYYDETFKSSEYTVDSIKASTKPSHFLGINKQGVRCVLKTSGNQFCHIASRGESNGVFDDDHIFRVRKVLMKAGLPQKILIDCLQTKSDQSLILQSVANQISKGDSIIFGIALEGSLDDLKKSTSNIENLAQAVKTRRELKSKKEMS